jgi:hypothetical protein
MKLSEEVLAQYEARDNNYEHHIDNFISKVKNMAKIQKVTILGDLDTLKAGIVNFVDFNTDIKDYLRKLQKEVAQSRKLIDRGQAHEGMNMFKNLYLEASIGLIKVLKSVKRDSTVDWRELAQLLGALEVE